MKKLLLIISLVSFTPLNSCHLIKDKGIEFIIENKSNLTFKNVRFTTSEKLSSVKLEKIEPKEIIKGFLSMKKNTNDGHYTIDFINQNGDNDSYDFGYYTNGAPVNHWVKLEIKNDTIIPRFSDAKIF